MSVSVQHFCRCVLPGAHCCVCECLKQTRKGLGTNTRDAFSKYAQDRTSSLTSGRTATPASITQLSCLYSWSRLIKALWWHYTSVQTCIEGHHTVQHTMWQNRVYIQHLAIYVQHLTGQTSKVEYWTVSSAIPTGRAGDYGFKDEKVK